MNFDDNWDKKFDKNFDRMTKGIFVLWAFGALMSLATTAVLIWAVIKIVNHFV
jgi:hypothetical protein